MPILSPPSTHTPSPNGKTVTLAREIRVVGRVGHLIKRPADELIFPLLISRKSSITNRVFSVNY